MEKVRSQTLAAAAACRSTDTSWADANLGAVDADLTASGRRVSVDLRAPDLELTGSGDVGIDAGDSVSAHGRWEPTDLAALSQRLGWSPPFPLSGSGSMRFDVSGPRDRPEELHIAADLDRLSLDVDGEAVRLAQPARLEYDARTLRVRNADLTVGGSHLTIAGSLGDPAAAGLVATLQGSVGDFEFLQHFVRPPAADHSELPAPDGAIAVRLAATGSVSAPVLSGSFQLRDGRLPITAQAAVTDANLTARYELGVLVIDDLRAAFEGATLTASGQVPADLFRDRLPARWRDLVPQTGGPATLTAQLSSVTQQAAAPFVDAATLESIAGRVDARDRTARRWRGPGPGGRNRRPEPRRALAVGCVVRSADADTAARARRPRRRRRLGLGTRGQSRDRSPAACRSATIARSTSPRKPRSTWVCSTRSPVPDAPPAGRTEKSASAGRSPRRPSMATSRSRRASSG